VRVELRLRNGQFLYILFFYLLRKSVPSRRWCIANDGELHHVTRVGLGELRNTPGLVSAMLVIPESDAGLRHPL
jgi:hypothetical protein